MKKSPRITMGRKRSPVLGPPVPVVEPNYHPDRPGRIMLRRENLAWLCRFGLISPECGCTPYCIEDCPCTACPYHLKRNEIINWAQEEGKLCFVRGKDSTGRVRRVRWLEGMPFVDTKDFDEARKRCGCHDWGCPVPDCECSDPDCEHFRDPTCTAGQKLFTLRRKLQVNLSKRRALLVQEHSGGKKSLSGTVEKLNTKRQRLMRKIAEYEERTQHAQHIVKM